MFPKSTKFLIIDDTKTIRTLLSEVLTDLGYKNISEADTGESGLEMMKKAHDNKDPFGFIFCDWNLPGMTGIDLLDFRNSDPRFKDVPFMIVTIESERNYVLKAVTMGVSEFIVKPFSKSTVRSKMQNVYNRLNKK